MELGIVWLIGAMLFRLVGLCLLGLKLFSVRRLSIELSCVGTVLTYAGILVLHDDFVGNILLVVLSFVVEFCLVWLIGAMLVRTLMFDSLLFELTFVGGISIEFGCVGPILVFAETWLFDYYLILNILFIILSLVVEFPGIGLVCMVLLTGALWVYFFGLELVVIRGFAVELGWVGPILTLTMLIALVSNLLFNVLLIVLCFIMEFCGIGLVCIFLTMMGVTDFAGLIIFLIRRFE